MNKQEVIKIRVVGVIGIVAAFLTILIDISIGLTDLIGSKYWKPLIGLNQFRLLFGSYGGVFIFPFWLFGIWTVYKAMKPAGFWWSSVPLILVAYLLNTVNVFIHSSYGFFSYTASKLQNTTNTVQPHFNELLSSFENYYNPLGLVFIFGYLIVAVWLMIPIFRGNTHLPKWVGLINPIFFLAISQIITLKISGFPHSIYKYIFSPTSVMMYVFIISTYYLWNGVCEKNKTA